MKVLIIDDAYDMLVPKFEEAGINVIKTGPSNNTMEGVQFAIQEGANADFILLDMELGTNLDAGSKILSVLSPELKEKVIAITGEPLGKKVFASMGITHTPGKRVSDIIDCMTNDCKCDEVKAEKDLLETSKCDVLITGSSAPLVKSIEKVLSTTMAQVKVVACINAKEAIGAIQELHPRLIISQGSGIWCAEHDYSHMQAADDSLPPLDELYGKVIVVGDNEDQTRANILGQDFMNQTASNLMVKLIEKINISLQSEDYLKELEIKGGPVFRSNLREELLTFARTMSPHSAATAAEDLTKDQTLTKACRWLAVLKRVFGPEKLEEVIARN